MQAIQNDRPSFSMPSLAEASSSFMPSQHAYKSFSVSSGSNLPPGKTYKLPNEDLLLLLTMNISKPLSSASRIKITVAAGLMGVVIIYSIVW